jgi:mono/diheme cytochrome c family protein
MVPHLDDFDALLAKLQSADPQKGTLTKRRRLSYDCRGDVKSRSRLHHKETKKNHIRVTTPLFLPATLHDLTGARKVFALEIISRGQWGGMKLLRLRIVPRLVLVLGVLLSLRQPAHAQESHIGGLTGDARRGKQLYRRYCVGCHGPLGDGRGENAPWIDPKPRNFVAGTFKCRSTPSGDLPSDEDLFKSVTRGFINSNMPSWLTLTYQQRADLVAYVKNFSPRFLEEKPPASVQVPSEPASNQQSIQRGNELYQKMNCWSCHGKEGRGDGPSAQTLVDNRGYPVPPYDFGTGTRFKCGDSNQDLYRILMTGLDGTPMPSFANSLTSAQTWDLVHYLRTLQLNLKHKPPKAGEERRDSSESKAVGEEPERRANRF